MATATIKPTVAPTKKRVYNSGKFFSAKADVSEKFVTIRLPAKVAKYLELTTGKNVYWSPVNGVIQISANVPNISIPILNVANSGFIPHS